MKKLLAFFLALILLLSLGACGKDTDAPQTSDSAASTDSQPSGGEETPENAPPQDGFTEPTDYYAVIQFDLNPSLRLYITNSVAITLECVNEAARADFSDLANDATFGGKTYAEAAEIIMGRAVQMEYDLTGGITLDYIGSGDRSEKTEILKAVVEGIKNVLDQNDLPLNVTPKIESEELAEQELDDFMEKFREPEPEPPTPTPPAPTGSEDTDWDAIFDYVSTRFAAYQLRSDGQELVELSIYFCPTDGIFQWEYISYTLHEASDPGVTVEYDGRVWERRDGSTGETGYVSGSQVVFTDKEFFAVFDCVDGVMKITQNYLLFEGFTAEDGVVFENTGDFSQLFW